MKASEKKALLAQGRTSVWHKTIYGSAQSKANNRMPVKIKGVLRFVKSSSAQTYLSDFLKQCPTLDPLFECDLTVEMNLYYQSRRNDVDESLVLDAMQSRIYRNDRQVRRKIITGYVDPGNPRAEITIYPFEETP